MALKLKRSGITRVRPLHGGIALWMDRAFPTTELTQSPVEGLAQPREN